MHTNPSSPRRPASPALWLALVASIASTGTVRAQAPASVSPADAAATSTQSPEPAATTPASGGATPAQPAPTPAPTSRIPVRAYGILWASGFASQGVTSFGNSNLSAPTAAINRGVYGTSNQPLLSFQVQQTRAGVMVGEGTPVRGTLEIDFIHFDQSSPTAQAFPRIRQALIEWNPNERHRLFMGQTWDLFGNTNSSLLSHSFNLVGTLFQAGNIGFMRHQIGWSGRFGDVEVATAVGLQGSNTGPVYTTLEQSYTPTGSARVMYNLHDHHGVVGVSGIATSLRFDDPAGGYERRVAFGGNAFADLTFGGLNIHAEAYIAQNLANTGALNLGQGRFGADVRDVGAYVSAKYEHGHHSVTGMVGFAAVLNPGDVVPSYTPYVAGVSFAAQAPTAGPGMLSNVSAHVGYWYSPVRGFSIAVEPYLYATNYKLFASDVARGVGAENVSIGLMLGSLYRF